jgi:hypothetical protein
MTKLSLDLQSRKENRLDRTGQQMLCHHCSSTLHLLSACPISPASKKIHFLSLLESGGDEEGVHESESDTEICLAWSWDGVTESTSTEKALSDTEIHKVLLANRTPRFPVTKDIVQGSGFLGICVDTGATSSVGGRQQYEEYLKSVIVPSSARILIRNSKRFNFVATSVQSNGMSLIRTPCSPMDAGDAAQPMSFIFVMDIVEIDVPLLMGLNVLRESGATVDIAAKVMSTSIWQAPIEFSHGHIFVLPRHGVILFSVSELTSLRRKLADIPASKLKGFLHRARSSDMDSSTRKAIDEISSDCEVCKRSGPTPGCVRSGIPSDNIQFNIKVSLDIFYVDARPVLHVSRIAEAEKHTIPSGDYFLSPDEKVLVFREKESCTGPATFLGRVGGSVATLFKGRKTTFPNTRVKPAFRSVGSAHECDDDDAQDDVGDILEDDVSDTLEDVVGDALEDDVSDTLEDDAGVALEHDIGDTEEISEHIDTCITDAVKNQHDKRFENAIKAKIAGLLSRDVFELVGKSTGPSGSNIMGSKFHLALKNSETTQPVCKERLVIFGHMDAEKGRILSEALTASQMIIRTLISLSIVRGWPNRSRDIRQAFLQSESLLSRTV